jgi:hypothetical protein
LPFSHKTDDSRSPDVLCGITVVRSSGVAGGVDVSSLERDSA